MKIPNPFGLAFRVIWWPFGFSLKLIGSQLIKSDRCWAVILRNLRAIGVPEESMREFEARRAVAVSGATFVVMPEGAVEKSESEQAAKPNEAKP